MPNEDDWELLQRVLEEGRKEVKQANRQPRSPWDMDVDELVAQYKREKQGE